MFKLTSKLSSFTPSYALFRKNIHMFSSETDFDSPVLTVNLASQAPSFQILIHSPVEVLLEARIEHNTMLERHDAYLRNLLDIYHIFCIFSVGANYLCTSGNLIQKNSIKASMYLSNRRAMDLYFQETHLKGLLLLHHLFIRNQIPLTWCS